MNRLIEMMEHRPTGYRRLGELPDMLAHREDRIDPPRDILNFEEHETRLVLHYRFTARTEDEVPFLQRRMERELVAMIMEGPYRILVEAMHLMAELKNAMPPENGAVTSNILNRFERVFNRLYNEVRP